MATIIDTTPSEVVPPRPQASALSAFFALMARDLHVLRGNLREFIPRTVIQPLLLVFVFTYVLPKIGQGIGGSGELGTIFSTLLVAGVVGTSIMFQGIQSVALPLVQEFGFTREIEDRVLAPLPVEGVALAKIASGSMQCLLSGLLVFPIALVIPATPVELDINWLVLITLIPLACISAAALGLTFGTFFEPRYVPVLFGVVVVPMTFLGCVYYSWSSLEAIPWLQAAVLLNPLVYISEGFRAALTPVPHLSLWAVYGVLTACAVGFTTLGVRSFVGRVID
jgi:ABC-2 type transport system permease protein